MAQSKNLALGIDLGTTSVKISLIDIDTRGLVFNTSEPTLADIPCPGSKDWAEQDVPKILKAACTCLTRVTEKNRNKICCVSISGQMHGILLWNSDEQLSVSDSNILSCSSSLITWEDKRATKDFLSKLPSPDSHTPIATGFGCVTLFWLLKNRPDLLIGYDTAGGIMDYLVMLLCGLDKPVMSNQIASSWGYFSCERNSWNFEILKEEGFPVHMLPMVVEGGSQVGGLCKDWFGIKRGTPVLVGLGDLQCSYLSAVKSETDAVLNISTSSQVCYPVACQGFVPPKSDTASPVTYFPYFKQTYLAVAASLNGGNVLEAFVKMLQQWFHTFGFEVAEEQIWQKLTQISTVSDMTPVPGIDLLSIQPLLYGERHSPDATASVTGITENGISLDCIFKSLCSGLVTNLHQMMPQSMLIESGVKRLVLTGSVVHKQPCVKDYVCKLYKPLHVSEVSEIDAAFGAALVGVEYMVQACSK